MREILENTIIKVTYSMEDDFGQRPEVTKIFMSVEDYLVLVFARSMAINAS